MGTLSETKDFVEKLPHRLNDILELTSTNKLRVKVDAVDEQRLMKGLQKIANRITVGLIISALIIGSSMLAHIETNFQVFGYPGLALILFLIAAACALFLMFTILFKDE